MDKSVKLYIFFCSLFCTVVITGNLIFQKFVTVNILSLEFELSVGVLLYPVTFLISDLTAEFYGNKYANHMIKMSVLCSFMQFYRYGANYDRRLFSGNILVKSR
jgi:hypothetical protein